MARRTLILLDTHVAIWYTAGIELKPQVTALIGEAALQNSVVLSAISAWEIGMLVTKGRLVLDFVITSESEWACYANYPAFRFVICKGAKASMPSWSRAGRGTGAPDGPKLIPTVVSHRRKFDPIVSPVADDRLQRLLGGSELAMLRKRLRRRFERCLTGAASERFRISDLSPVEHTTLAGLLGRSPRFSDSLEVEVGSLDDVLQRAGIAVSLRAALEALDGPILSLADERTRAQSQWSTIVAACEHPGLREMLQTPAGIGLLKRCARGDVPTATELCLHAQAVLSRLPARSVTRAQLAATVLGDAHALDAGRAEATIVLAVLRYAVASARVFAHDPATAVGDDLADDAARDVWARAGVLVNELARPVLFLNLPRDANGSLTSIAGEPGYLSLRTLARLAPAWSATDCDIFICENPNLVAIAADELGSRCAPLVCTEGMPAAAQRLLLTQLATAGAKLRYHGDFEWAGLRIGNVLMRELDIQPWRFGVSDYLCAIETAGGRRHPLSGAEVLASWDERLTLAMRDHQIAIAEEAVAGVLLSDLDAG